MPNLTALSANMAKASALSNLILVTPNNAGYQPQNKPNPDGSQNTSQPPPAFLFNYEGEQIVALESDITDHYVEDNTAMQDQIALRPELFTTHGFIGELNNVAPALLEPLKFAADKLTAISAYAPSLSRSAQLAYNNATAIYQTAASVSRSAVSAWNSLTGGETQTKQQVAFQQFYGYWRDRVLFTVQTPWCVFQNMAIKNLRAIQSEETNVVTDFEVTFKIIRTVQSLTVSGLGQFSYSGRLNSQSAPLTNLGTSQPNSSTSLSSALSGMGVA